MWSDSGSSPQTLVNTSEGLTLINSFNQMRKLRQRKNTYHEPQNQQESREQMARLIRAVLSSRAAPCGQNKADFLSVVYILLPCKIKRRNHQSMHHARKTAKQTDPGEINNRLPIDLLSKMPDWRKQGGT